MSNLKETDLYKKLLGVKKPTLNPSSGGWYGDGVTRPFPKKQIEDCLALSSLELMKLGLLLRLKTEMLEGTLTWETSPPVTIRFESCPWYIRLMYSVYNHREDDKIKIDYTIPIEWQQKGRPEEGYIYFSPVFHCPGKEESCGKKASKLFLPPGEDRFLCKKCHDLAYRSEQDTTEREARKFFKAVGLLK